MNTSKQIKHCHANSTEFGFDDNQLFLILNLIRLCAFVIFFFNSFTYCAICFFQQYFFDEEACLFLIKTIRNLEYEKVVCIGTPRYVVIYISECNEPKGLEVIEVGETFCLIFAALVLLL